MSSNPADILQEKMQAFIKKCPRIAGRYAVAHFQDNIRKRGGVPVNGSLKRFEPRGFDEPGPRRAILLKTGNLSDAIKIIHEASTWVSVGISERRIKRYAQIHQTGGNITVTPQMKKYFWAMYYKSAGKVSYNIKSRKAANTKQNLRHSSYAEMMKAMALKKTGSSIEIPKREFMRFTPDVERGILREFKYEMKKVIEQVQRKLA